MRSKLFTSFCLFAEANIHRCSGNREQCLNALRDALGLAQEMGHVTSGACPRDHARELYAIALEADIYPEYARKVIVMTRLEAPFNSLPENWPWQIRLYTLGRFTVLKDDSPLVFSGRTQKKPLDLLRMLIVFGGRNVSVAKLIQVLWPDADGDMARTAFRTTLHRLRRLLGEKSILMTESQLSLNPRTCWLDTWFLERCTDDFEMTTSAAVQTRRLLNVYRGAFLERDNSSPIVIERERLRAKFLQAVGRVGQALENESDIPSAVALYERGLETEPLAEDLYRRLMQCHVRAGRIEEAIAVYRRCEAELLSVLKVRPGNEIRAVYDRIKNTRPPDKLAI